MKNIYIPSFIFLTVLTLFMTSCQDVVEVDLEQGIKRLVVEGNITDIPNYTDTIKLSYNSGFYDESGIDYLQNAFVTITDDANNIDTLTEYTTGHYITSSSYRGVAGRSYSLYVESENGKEYYSDQDYMEPVPAMDSFYLKQTDDYYKELGWPEIVWGDNRYQLHIDFMDNPFVGNSYNWNVWKNDTNLTDEGEGFYVRDEFFGQDPEGEYWENLIYFDADFKAGDSVYVEQYTLSPDEFRYKNTLDNSESSNAFDAFFGTTPAPVESNIHSLNDASELEIGFFGAHSVVSNYVIIPELPE